MMTGRRPKNIMGRRCGDHAAGRAMAPDMGNPETWPTCGY